MTLDAYIGTKGFNMPATGTRDRRAPECQDNPRLFDSTRLADHARARLICERCPYETQCLVLALRLPAQMPPTGGVRLQPVGTWAGHLFRYS